MRPPSKRCTPICSPAGRSSTNRCTTAGPDSTFTLEVRTNWKLAVENYCESYHLPWVHPGLNSYSRLEDHYHIEAPGRYSGQGTLVYRQLRGADGTVFPDFAGLSAQWDEGAEYVALYPNVLLGVHRDHAYAIVLEPVSHDPHGGAYASLLPFHRDGCGPQGAQRNTVERGLHRGYRRRGGHAARPFRRRQFDGGRFSPAMDGPTHCFHAWVAGRGGAGGGSKGDRSRDG
jgi:choline monooxygenase